MTDVPQWLVGLSTAAAALVLVMVGIWRSEGSRAAMRILIGGAALAVVIVLLVLVWERM